MNKTIADGHQAVAGVLDSSTLMIGGFGGSGAPIELIHALIDRYHASGRTTRVLTANAIAAMCIGFGQGIAIALEKD